MESQQVPREVDIELTTGGDISTSFLASDATFKDPKDFFNDFEKPLVKCLDSQDRAFRTSEQPLLNIAPPPEPLRWFTRPYEDGDLEKLPILPHRCNLLLSEIAKRLRICLLADLPVDPEVGAKEEEVAAGAEAVEVEAEAAEAGEAALLAEGVLLEALQVSTQEDSDHLDRLGHQDHRDLRDHQDLLEDPAETEAEDHPREHLPRHTGMRYPLSKPNSNQNNSRNGMAIIRPR
ncbi:hypothetical protein B0H11DRAFT_2229530 [Mycena galericulata]|nr:hypothetical protein B0H11DRAFT_2229530 [Mycena galericulata]